MSIAKLRGQVSRLDELTYSVKSQSGSGEYQIIQSELGWLCSCPDHVYRGLTCKHIFAVEFSQKIRHTVQQTVTTIKPIDVQACIACNSDRIVRNAKRKTKHGEIQRYKCKTCGKRFSINLGFEKMRATPQVITTCMQLYYSGESLRGVQKFLELQGIKKSHMAVYGWIGKYTRLMEDYLSKITPQVSDTWRADELWLKIKGDMKYLFAMMDDETRFWIAQEVADTKFKHDARGLFRQGKEVAGKRPAKIITDGLRSYHDAYKREFYTQAYPRTEHEVSVMTQGQRNNNKMERMNGEIRDREKTMRGLKRKDTPILKGIQLYHNAIKPHMGLKGKTPLEACGVSVQGENKWITLIQNASKL